MSIFANNPYTGDTIADATHRRNVEDMVARINALFGQRAPEYKQYQTDTYNTLKQGLDQNADATKRNLTFGLARKGLTGGSADADARGEFLRDYSQGVLNAMDQARRAAAALKSADAATKAQLTGLVTNGMDATQAEQLGLAGMQANNQLASGYIVPQAVSDVFGSLGKYYNSNQAQQGYADAIKQLMQLYGNSGYTPAFGGP